MKVVIIYIRDRGETQSWIQGLTVCVATLKTTSYRTNPDLHLKSLKTKGYEA
jgi:hypothetical protein